MQFNSYFFLLFFFPIFLILYFGANKISVLCGKFVLISASIMFYAFGRVHMLIYLGISLAINYLFIYLINRRCVKNRILLYMSVAVNISLLLYFKYYNFFGQNISAVIGKEWDYRNIILPLGISFYTFQQVAYLVAVYRKELSEGNLVDYLAYILYFPKLLMGPLTEPVNFLSQLNDPVNRKPEPYNICKGIQLFSFGLIKKVWIADQCAMAVTWVYENMSEATSADLLILLLCYTFEIYFDFSGYSDMAAGTALMMNIKLPINFNLPYKAVSIREFWKRWHISLTDFFTKYVYYPLGGSKKGKLHTYINVMIIFILSGLWHGDNWTFLLWGGGSRFVKLYGQGI